MSPSAPNTPQQQPNRAPGTPPPIPPHVVERGKIAKTLSSIPLTAPEKAIDSVILDGGTYDSLEAGLQKFSLKSGDLALCSTYKGPKDKNEDRIAIRPEDNMIAVIDGMGGMGKGDIAAEDLARAFLDFPNSPKHALQVASAMMHYDETEKGGACYASARIIEDGGKKFAELSMAGDVKAIIVRGGQIVFESTDESVVEYLLKHPEPGKRITPDQALYHEHRAIVTNAVTKDKNEVAPIPRISVKKGDLLILMTDGVTDNVTPDELVNEIAKRNMKPDEIMQYVSDEVTRRMRDASLIMGETEKMAERKMRSENKPHIPGDGRKELGYYSDGYRSAPKKDNAGIGIIEIM